jgi:hypothetical protein
MMQFWVLIGVPSRREALDSCLACVIESADGLLAGWVSARTAASCASSGAAGLVPSETVTYLAAVSSVIRFPRLALVVPSRRASLTFVIGPWSPMR